MITALWIAVLLIVVALVVTRCCGRTIMERLHGPGATRAGKEPVDASAARLEKVTERLVTATEELQRTVDALAPLRTGASRVSSGSGVNGRD